MKDYKFRYSKSGRSDNLLPKKAVPPSVPFSVMSVVILKTKELEGPIIYHLESKISKKDYKFRYSKSRRSDDLPPKKAVPPLVPFSLMSVLILETKELECPMIYHLKKRKL